MADGIKVGFDAVREIGYASILAGFAAVGSATSDYARLICFNNGTNADVYVSIDNSSNHLRIAANSFRLLDLMSNKTPYAPLFLEKGISFYVKRVSGAPTSGTFWIEVVNGLGGR